MTYFNIRILQNARTTTKLGNRI